MSPPVARRDAAQAALPLRPPGFDPDLMWDVGREVRLPSPFAFGETVARMTHHLGAVQVWDLAFAGVRYATVRADFSYTNGTRFEVEPEPEGVPF